MAAIVCNDPLARCVEGNLFRFNGENVGGTVEGRVNGMGTGALPHGERMILPNDLPGTCNALEMRVNGRTFPLVDNLHDYPLGSARDLGVLMSDLPAGTGSGGAVTPEDVLVVGVPASLEGASPGEGAYDINTADEGALQWMALSILVALEQVEDTIGIDAIRDATGGMLDLGLTGTDGPPLVIDVVSFLRSRNGREAMRLLVHSAQQTVHVMRNGAGSLVIALRMKTGMGRLLAAGIAATLTRSRMAHVVTGARGALAQPAGVSAAARLPIIGYVIVGVIDVVEWYSNPDSRGDWSMLISTLFVDFSALTISTLIGIGAATFATAILGGAAALTLGGAIIVAGAGIGAALVAGAFLSWVARATGADVVIDRMLTEVGNALSAAAQGAVTLVGRFADSLIDRLEAIDEAVYDPMDWARDVDRGFNSILRDIINGNRRGTGFLQ